ncbi:hypothetical protein, partial [Acinetobacter baumannii]|uniref:hypothetical protein n=1 Tax=Acinetobacter baumannii TaxID=470 RepID=UPI0011787119
MQGIESEIRYKQKKENVVADFLSRLEPSNDVERETTEQPTTKHPKRIAVTTRRQQKLLDDIGVAPMTTTSADDKAQANAPAATGKTRKKQTTRTGTNNADKEG